VSFLNKSGADIRAKGGAQFKITGNKELKGINHTTAPDYVEEGTFAALAAATGSHITITNGYFDDIRAPLFILSSMNVDYLYKGDELEILPSTLTAPDKRIQSGPYPNFPTDLMSPFIVLATQAQGQTLLHDPLYESRMFFVDKLISMGAGITICDPHRVIVNGPSKLHGSYQNSPDIRAGMALVIAALIAEGESTIDHAEIIERGYETIADRLFVLGADIKKIE
jgi:UDP-N-acetylglucosamine 1-carboxyvinyltransferase